MGLPGQSTRPSLWVATCGPCKCPPPWESKCLSTLSINPRGMIQNDLPPKKNWKLDHKKSEFLMFLDVFKHRDFEPGHGAMIHHDHWNWGNCFSISRWNPQCSASSVVCNTTSECNGVISCFCTLQFYEKRCGVTCFGKLWVTWCIRNHCSAVISCQVISSHAI